MVKWITCRTCKGAYVSGTRSEHIQSTRHRNYIASGKRIRASERKTGLSFWEQKRKK